MCALLLNGGAALQVTGNPSRAVLLEQWRQKSGWKGFESERGEAGRPWRRHFWVTR